MFVHIGGDVVVPVSQIIAILDEETFSAAATRSFLEMSLCGSCVKNPGVRGVKSYLITDNGVYLSVIAPGTLLRRINELSL